MKNNLEFCCKIKLSILYKLVCYLYWKTNSKDSHKKNKKRGLFISSTGVKLNADVNGALGIMLKEGRGKSLITQLSSGVVNTPRRIRIGEIRQTSSKRLIKTLFS